MTGAKPAEHATTKEVLKATPEETTGSKLPEQLLDIVQQLDEISEDIKASKIGLV